MNSQQEDENVITGIEIAQNAKAHKTTLHMVSTRCHVPIVLLNRTPLRLKVQARASLDHETSFSTDGEESTSSSLQLDELRNRGCRHVRFASTLEQEIVIPPDNWDGSTSWYTTEELEQIELERLKELDAVSRGLRRRGDKAFGKVLYRNLMRFHHIPAEEDAFLIDLADFKLLHRYMSRNPLTGFERSVEELVDSETKALIGNVQQSVMMVQAMIRGDDNAHECIRCASIRYSTASQRFARALGEIHSHVVKL